MTNAELIKALRYCGQEQDVIDCADCERRVIENGVDVDCEGRLLRDAADALEAADKRIADLETALAACRVRRGEQLPKEGEWIPVTNGRGGHECSLCHGYAPTYQTGYEHLSDYCPNCGARMKGEQE